MNRQAESKSNENPCHQCSSSAFAFDKFCRRCGVRRSAAPVGIEMQTTALLAPKRDLQSCDSDEATSYTTAPLQTADVCHAISATLVHSVTRNLRAKHTMWLNGRWSKSLGLVLISIPVWLMIVLLSPLDAYVAVRSMAEQ